MLAGFLITMGTLGDGIGRRRLLLIGSAAFGVASVVAAYSASPEMLIAARALLGITGCSSCQKRSGYDDTGYKRLRNRFWARAADSRHRAKSQVRIPPFAIRSMPSQGSPLLRKTSTPWPDCARSRLKFSATAGAFQTPPER
jgi:hypothetical protein